MTDTSTSSAFSAWPEAMVKELEANRDNGHVGHKLVSETDAVRVWHLSLEPGERIGFHCHVLNYFWTALNGGRARSHYSDGRIADVNYVPGETKHISFGAGDRMQHDLHNIGDTTLLFVTVEFKMGPNAPLQL